MNKKKPVLTKNQLWLLMDIAGTINMKGKFEYAPTHGTYKSGPVDTWRELSFKTLDSLVKKGLVHKRTERKPGFDKFTGILELTPLGNALACEEADKRAAREQARPFSFNPGAGK